MGRVTDYRELAQKLKPYIAPWIVAQGNSQAASSAVSGMSAHALSGAYHTGTLAQSQAPWAVTDDEFAVHTSNPDAHHATATAGNGIIISGQAVAVKLPTNSGLTADGTGLYLAPSTLTVTTTNSLSAGAHAHAVTTTTSGAVSTIVALDSNGYTTAARWIATDRVRTPLIDTASGNMAISPAADLNLTPTGDVSLNPSGGEVYVPGNRTLRSSIWTSGVLGSGWGIQERGGSGKSHLDIRSIYTDELIATTFTADQVRVRSGSDWLGESLAIAARDNSDAKVTIPNVGGGSVRIYVEDAPEVTGQIFDANEYVLIKTINRSSGLVIRETWGQVSSYIAESGGRQSYSWTTVSGAGGFTLEPGTALIGFGASGGSYIYRSVIEAGKGPFERFATWSTNPYTPANRVSRVEIGDIKNAAGDSTTRYGIAAGNNLALTPATGFSGFTADSVNGMQIYNGAVSIYDSSSLDLQMSANGIRIKREASADVGSVPSLNAVTWYSDAIGGTVSARVVGWRSGGADERLAAYARATSSDTAIATLEAGHTGGDLAAVWTQADSSTSIVAFFADSVQLISSSISRRPTLNSGTVYTIWDSGNDGSGSGLDADKLDAYEATAFPLLAGRAGGQTLNGGTASGDDLYIDSTAHATKGDILLAPNGGNVSIGNGIYAANATLEITKNGYTTVGPTMRLNNNSVGGVGDAARVEFYDAGSLRAYLEWQIISGGSPKWLFYDAFNSATRLEIGGDGLVNVGAATNTYSAKLAVAGNVHAYGGVVTAEDYLQVKQRSGSPGGATGFGRIYYDSGDDKLKYITSGGTVRTLSYT